MVEQLQLNSITFFQGWLFCDGWFIEDIFHISKAKDKILTYLQPLAKYQANRVVLISNICNQIDIIIGVNIRPEDCQNYQHGKYFYKTVSCEE
ncbi:hypothetical protein [Anabaena catenula]|uniref:Uncharacterized protein n=1 Tax=Anabaena catenula FACHB-362 TaxID=2692877 RepID=A0ABR8J8U4_9NOST|nr:hypothetical protein [Anabaena catenula]MBD2694630.1 hypothetical protein [Anabaena catenula FACHB-362]